MRPIQTCLWFDDQGEAAATEYVALFGGGSKVGRAVAYGDAAARASRRPAGSTMTVEFELAGSRLLGLNGGPVFDFDPSMSFVVACESEREIDALWAGLSGEIRMPLQAYPFARKYGWREDRFGVNWQLLLPHPSPGPVPQKIAPALLFANSKLGRAHEAIDFYVATLPGSKVQAVAKEDKTGRILHSRLTLAGQDFVLMEGPTDPSYDFSPAMSFVVECATQAELDGLWSKLSAEPEAEQCGWLRDRFGVSWQLVPERWGETLVGASPTARERLMGAVLEMKKLDIATLERAAR